MEEPAKLEQPLESSSEPLVSDSLASLQSSDTNALIESPKHDIGAENVTQPDAPSLDSPTQCQPSDGCQVSSTQSIDIPMPPQSSGESDVPKTDESKACKDPSSCPQAKEVSTAEALNTTKLDSTDSTLPSNSGGEVLNIPKPSDFEVESPPLSPLPTDSGGESPKASTLPSESSGESPKASTLFSESRSESPTSIGGTAELDAQSLGTSESPKSESSSGMRRPSKLLASYSMRRPSKVNMLASQIELAVSEREKDVALKQEYKAQDESLKGKRESLLKQMRMEEKKAKLERKASTRAGTSFITNLNATKKDLRKEDLNKKKEEDERNRNLLLQRGRDEKLIRKSIYQSGNSPLGTSSPNSSSRASSPSPSPSQDAKE